MNIHSLLESLGILTFICVVGMIVAIVISYAFHFVARFLVRRRRCRDVDRMFDRFDATGKFGGKE